MIVKSYLDYARGERPLSPWCILAPFGWIAGGLTRLRNFAYDHGVTKSLDSPVPLVSVGNLTLGGTNKTPFVEMISLEIARRGIRTGVVSRGYKGKARVPELVGRPGSGSFAGDEPLLLQHRLQGLPVAVANDRSEGISLLCEEEGVELVVADDAFQHRKLRRDADIVLVDALCPWGNGHLFPAGLLRESAEALERAHLVVITKADQVPAERLEELKAELSAKVGRDRVFCSRLTVDRWDRWAGGWKEGPGCRVENIRVLAFSAIGNPASFRRSLEQQGVVISAEFRFRDHHRFSLKDLEMLASEAARNKSEALVCSEKDIYNLPEGWIPPLPLYVPRVKTEVLEEPDRFWETLWEALRPRVVVASNGYGEDAIGVILGEKLRHALPKAEILAFPLVGAGKPYAEAGFSVVSPPAETPSGGIVKYNFFEFVRDLRFGLVKIIMEQLKSWHELRHRLQRVFCVGDVYLALQALWGQGGPPLLVATAKTAYIAGHWGIERFVLKHRVAQVWARDEDTALELLRSGVKARFSGNPIMDLAGSTTTETFEWPGEAKYSILLLPGSRTRAYAEFPLLLNTAELVSARQDCRFLAVIAPTIDRRELVSRSAGWEACSAGVESLSNGRTEIFLYDGNLPAAARGADLVIGLGGTANQLCAGLGIPVLSVEEKGKLVQKRILQDAERLVAADPRALAHAALEILESPDLRLHMSRTGIARLGTSGALDEVVRFAVNDLGLGLREAVHSRLCGDAEGGKHL
jgi:tetraacyldisaccharide 4'-kinase